MAKVLVVYYSRSGNTESMAGLISDGLRSHGVDVILKSVEEASPDDMAAADGVVIGSPTYYGTMAAKIKELIDDSVGMHSELDGKVGAAFSTAANIAGGSETTVLSILEALLIHGFIIQGDPVGSHYGPVSIGSPDKRVEDECARFAGRFAALVKKNKR